MLSDPAIDFTAIRFPSDELTVGQLRQLWPESFDHYPIAAIWCGHIERSADCGSLDESLGTLIDCERIYADNVFRREANLTMPNGIPPQPEAEAAALLEMYESENLGRGDHERREWVRRIETQAVAQARQHTTRSR